jgi:hypothetical protein
MIGSVAGSDLSLLLRKPTRDFRLELRVGRWRDELFAFHPSVR